MNNLTIDHEAQPPASNKGVNITIQNFATEVIEASQKQLVVLYFWSTQSPASQNFMPLLEKAVAHAGSKAKLTKVNIAENQQIAQQLRVQSIPAVYAFWQGQPVDGFMGAIPESQLGTWLSSTLSQTGATGEDDPKVIIQNAVEQAEQFFAANDIETALAIYQDLDIEFPENESITAGMIECLVALGRQDEAKTRMTSLPPKFLSNQKIQSAKATIELSSESCADDKQIKAWEEALVANPENHQVRFDMAMSHYSAGNAEKALDELFEIIRRDRKWQDDAARLQVLKIFNALGATHEVTVEGRRKLSSILFS